MRLWLWRNWLQNGGIMIQVIIIGFTASGQRVNFGEYLFDSLADMASELQDLRDTYKRVVRYVYLILPRR